MNTQSIISIGAATLHEKNVLKIISKSGAYDKNKTSIILRFYFENQNFIFFYLDVDAVGVLF